jgi:hypothetical protein
MFELWRLGEGHFSKVGQQLLQIVVGSVGHFVDLLAVLFHVGVDQGLGLVQSAQSGLLGISYFIQ